MFRNLPSGWYRYQAHVKFKIACICEMMPCHARPLRPPGVPITKSLELSRSQDLRGKLDPIAGVAGCGGTGGGCQKCRRAVTVVTQQSRLHEPVRANVGPKHQHPHRKASFGVQHQAVHMAKVWSRAGRWKACLIRPRLSLAPPVHLPPTLLKPRRKGFWAASASWSEASSKGPAAPVIAHTCVF